MDAKIVDGTGKVLIPGLWNNDLHGPAYGDAKAPLLSLVSYGVTTVRDMGASLDERETIKNGNYQSVVHLNVVARSSIESLGFGAIATELHVAPPSRVVPASIQEEPSTGFLTAFANVVNVR